MAHHTGPCREGPGLARRQSKWKTWFLLWALRDGVHETV